MGEANQGGELGAATLRTVDPGVPYRAVHASRGTRTRAEPVAALYEQSRVHHVGAFPALEDPLCAALPERGAGPDGRLDALVWACSELGLAGPERDTPGLANWIYGIWACRCGRGFGWAKGRRGPYCGTPGPGDLRWPGGATRWLTWPARPGPLPRAGGASCGAGPRGTRHSPPRCGARLRSTP